MKIFDLKSAGTTFSHEIMGGVVTFMTMSYIIFVQPSILANAGMDFGAITFATCISSAIATLIMGLYAKLPIAQAPGMGENIFFTYTVVIGMGLAWTDALGAVFVAGVIFLILSILKVREKILNSIPISLRYAIAVGIGLFISFIGMINSGIIIKSVSGVLQIGDVHSYHFLLALFCLFVVMILMIKKVPGAIFIGIIISTIVALSTGAIQYCGIISTPPSPAPTFLKLSLSNIFNHHFLTAVFIFLFLDVFDTVGTLFAVAATGNLLTKDGKIKSGSKAMLSDAIGTVVGALFGTSTVTSYIESTTGIVAGARTGLSSVVVALLFLLSLFFYPIIRLVGSGMIVGNSVFSV
jgi:AGZA family xanthine/uracil permease-like MFS transporter